MQFWPLLYGIKSSYALRTQTNNHSNLSGSDKWVHYAGQLIYSVTGKHRAEIKSLLP